MDAAIGQTLVADPIAQLRSQPFEVYDTRLSGFVLRVHPNGVRSYYARFGRYRRFALGKVESIDPDPARQKCYQMLGNIAHGRHPMESVLGTPLAYLVLQVPCNIVAPDLGRPDRALVAPGT